jgi:carboxylesterase
MLDPPPDPLEAFVPIAPEDEAFDAPASPDGVDGRRIGVLLCHGFTGGPSSLRPWAEHLHSLGYAVSVPRWPGHGTTWQDCNTTGYADWYSAAEGAFEKLQAECDQVFVTGLSMGGCLALNLAVEKARDVRGLVLVNPAVGSARKDVKLLPFLKHVVPSFPAIGNDIKKEGVTERAYDRTPLRAAHAMFQGMRSVRDRLPEVTQPLLMFRSRVDRVVDPSSGRIIMTTVSSRDLTEQILEDSYHVATLDNDAPTIFAGSADFIRRVSAG